MSRGRGGRSEAHALIFPLIGPHIDRLKCVIKVPGANNCPLANDGTAYATTANIKVMLHVIV